MFSMAVHIGWLGRVSTGDKNTFFPLYVENALDLPP